MLTATAIAASTSTRLQCGTVYTWNCAGEPYAIECALCEERPLCTLDEFAEHMEVWHSDWQVNDAAHDELPEQAEDELMQEVLAEQMDGVDNELKQQLVQEINATAEQPQTFQEALLSEDAAQPCEPQPPPSLNQQIDFGLNDALPLPVLGKLTTQHVSRLIELYREEPLLWNQSHADFRDTERCREAWQRVTNAWSEHCQREFTVTDVRIRISTLCQRFLKQRQRLEAEGELDEAAKFVHYEQLSFLCKQQALLKRHEHFVRENGKLLEIYEHYPILWHNAHKRVRCAETVRRRQEALRGLQMALRLCGINLSALSVQRRLQSLRKRYRLEKIRYLHCVVEGKQAEFVSTFEHYAAMEFLHKHIDPYVCAVCGKIFENLVSHQTHVQGSCKAVQMQQLQLYGKAAEADGDEDAAACIDGALELEAEPAREQQQQDFEVTVGEIMAQLENAMAKENLVDTAADFLFKVQCPELGYELQLSAAPTASTVPTPPASTETEAATATAKNTATAAAEPAVEAAPAAVETLPAAAAAVSAVAAAAITEEAAAIQPPALEVASLAAAAVAVAAAVAAAEADLAKENESKGEQQPLLHGRLTIAQTHKLIGLYKEHGCLWDPNHLDYHDRKQRRMAWHNITAQMCEALNGDKPGAGFEFRGVSRYSWQMLHRKVTDYTKYYRRERDREATTGTKWSFYDDFRFLDDVVPISSELQKTLQQRDNNLKIIEVYRTYAQLWCTDHPDYTKRKQRQRHLESFCTRLQEESNLQITVERLKGRLLEFRCQYRQCKQARMSALANNNPWTASYEYYEALQFLEPHVSPFSCAHCSASFKRRSDYLHHERNVHVSAYKEGTQLDVDGLPGESDAALLKLINEKRRRRGNGSVTANELEHICHICGMKFSLRTSLLAHLRRHLGQRTHVCTMCPKKFFNATALRVHVRSHTKEQPYVCEHCARGFVNASKLNQHVKRHRDQRDFPCSRCEKAFYTAHERDRHIRAHLNIRDKICPYCSRAFVVGSAYYAHLNLHRGEKRYACTTCGRRFAQYAGLYKHRKCCLPTELLEE